MRQKQKFGKFLGSTFNICENGWLSANIDSHHFHKWKLSYKLCCNQRAWLGAFCGWIPNPTTLSCYKVWVAWWWYRFKEARNFLSQVMIFFSLFDFCLFVCFFGLVLFCFVCLFGFFFFFSFPPYFLMIASRKYIQLSSSVSYLFSCCVRLLV